MATDYSSLLADSSKSYSDILSKYQDRISQSQQMASTLGQNQLEQAGNYWQQQAANSNQSSYGRGLANSTIQGSMLQGVNQARGYDMNQINNSINAQKAALYQQTSGDFLNAYSGAAGAMTQQRQFGQQLGQQGSQFDRSLAMQGDQFNRNLDFQRQMMMMRGQGGMGGGGGGDGYGSMGMGGGNDMINSANSFSAANQAWGMGGMGAGGYGGMGGYSFPQSYGGGGFTAYGDLAYSGGQQGIDFGDYGGE